MISAGEAAGFSVVELLVGSDRETAKWAEIDKQTGRFRREVPK